MYLLVTKVRHPGEGHYRIHASLRVIDDRPIHLAPRQRGEGGAQRVSVGRVRGTRSICSGLEWNREKADRLRRGNGDAPHPPIASQWAPPSPRFAGERCMGDAWPRHRGPKMYESDSGEGGDPSLSRYGYPPMKQSRGGMGPGLRRDDSTKIG